jgi:hypothetical protein
MPHRLISDARHWAELADKMRKLAERMTAGASRDAAINIADEYQRFANKMAAREAELGAAAPLVPSTVGGNEARLKEETRREKKKSKKGRLTCVESSTASRRITETYPT